MNKTMQFRVRPGERLFLNGAAMEFDRKVLVEFLNDVTFLLKAHVLRPEQAETPLKQLYFVVQLNLIELDKKETRYGLVEKTLADVRAATRDPSLCEGLDRVRQLIEADRCFDALKLMRRMFPIEAELLTTDARPNAGRADACPLPAALGLKSS